MSAAAIATLVAKVPADAPFGQGAKSQGDLTFAGTARERKAISTRSKISHVRASSYARELIRFRNLTENVGEDGSMPLTGEIVQKCDFLRNFLVLVFGDMVKEQKMGPHIKLVSANPPKGPSVQDRADVLEETEVYLAESAILGGAFVVNLKDQLEDHAEWKNWPNKPGNPHITLASIGEENMEKLLEDQKNLVLKTLRCLSVNGKGLSRKLIKTADYVRPLMENSPNNFLISKAIDDVADIIMVA